MYAYENFWIPAKKSTFVYAYQYLPFETVKSSKNKFSKQKQESRMQALAPYDAAFYRHKNYTTIIIIILAQVIC